MVNCNIPDGSDNNSPFVGSKFNDVIIGNSVTSIGSYAFYGCSSLASVTIGNSVTTIGDRAFAGCSGMTILTIPSSVTSIGNEAFFGVGIRKINVSVTNYSAFCNNKVMGYICETFDYPVTLIDRNGNEIKEFVIPYGVTKIDKFAFYYCIGLTSVTIPNSITSISDGAFRRCSGLTSVSIPSSVTSIGYYAFSYCFSLTSVTVDWETPLVINSTTFQNSNLFNVTLYVPSGCKKAYQAADYWKDFRNIVGISDSNVITFTDANVKALCVANWDTNGDGELSEGEAADVTSLDNVFRNNQEIVSFGELQYFTGLTSICENAFQFCETLTSVTLPNSVTSIEADAFNNSGLTSITIPQSVTSISDRAFCYTGLTAVVIPKSVVSIGEINIFGGCTALKSIVVEDGNPVYDSRENCNGIIKTATNELIAGFKTTVIPESVTSIGKCAFAWDAVPITYTIPNSVTSIGDMAFYNCKELESLTFSNQLMTIGKEAFFQCNSLKVVTFPNSVTSISDDAFEGCSSLTSVHISDLDAWCKIAFGNSTSNPLYYAHHLFLNGEEIKDLVIPNSVTSIGDYAFIYCSSLTNVTIPYSVTSIGCGAFYECSSLISVTVENPMPVSITRDVFSNRANATLYVPYGSKATYETANYWKDFKEIVEIVGDNIIFADAHVKEICVANWDTNGDGELSEKEAKSVTCLGSVFKNKDITSFDELRYFTGLTTLDELAFYSCTSLKSIIIPKGIKSISDNCVLAGCDALTSLKVDEDNVYYDSRDNCNAIIETATNKLVCGCPVTKIPNNVTTIGYGAFSSLKNLTGIIIPTSVVTIEYGAFGFTGLTSITIPESVSNIEEYAFNDGKNSNAVLTSVTVEIKKPLMIEKNTFL